MNVLKEEVDKIYGNKVRVRACGIAIYNNKVLLIKHHSIGEKGYLWAPPGGGIDFGETTEETLIREFKEETGLQVEVQQFLFINEYINPPLHAVELFFMVQTTGGALQLGIDPEMTETAQMIQDIKFFSIEDIRQEGLDYFHNLFRFVNNIDDIKQMKGYYSQKI